MKVRSEIILIIAVIFIAIIGGVSASDTNQTDDVVSIEDESSLVDTELTLNTDDSVKLNESSDIREDSSNTNGELAGTDVKEESKNIVSVSNSKSNEVLGASNDNEVLGATLASLQTAIDNAGNTLGLTQDYIVGSDSRDYGLTIISKNIVINGNGHVLDAGERGLIIYITGENTITFNDLTFQNAVYSATSGDTRYYGGAVYVTGRATLTFNNCKFINNKRYSGSNLGYGGAIASTGGGTFTFNNCDFIQNSAYTSGGAIYSFNGGSFTLNNCNFEENSAPNGGGAIYDRTGGSGRSTYTITNCNFTRNTAGSTAPLYINPIELSISGCNFINNTGYQEGCLYIYNSLTPVTISNSNFIGNTATSTEEGYVGRGGAIRFNDIDDVTVDNCYFENNRAMYGGALYSPYQPDGSQIINSEFINNVATSNGGAIYWNANNTVFRNNIFERNGAQDGAGIYIGFSVLGTIVDNCEFNFNNAISLGGAIKFINDNDNVQIVNSEFNDNEAQYGGSISFGPSSDNVEINHCNFSENDAIEYGGAVYFDGSAESIKIADSTFDKNFGSSGGAIHFYSGINVESYKDIDITNCNFTLNDCTSADARYGGSAIGFNWANDINIDNCDFIGNNASSNGAVMFDYCYDVSFNECDFIDNYAGRYAGAVYFFNVFNGSNASFVECTFNNNTAGRSGGAIATNLFSVYYENLNNIYKNWIISDCEFTNNSALLSGGAAYLPWISYANLDNLVFDNNYAEDSGALYMSGDTITAKDISFTNNKATASDSGALFIGVGSSTDVYSTFDSLTFENNSAYSNGGAISGTASNVNITNSDFTNNSAWYGGAIYWTTGSNINIKKNSFTENQANSAGAIDIYGVANVKIEESSFINNTATVDAGAVWFNSNGGSIANCEFIDNTAGDDGAAVILDSSRQTITACTFTNNVAGGRGGAIYDTGVGADNSNTISESTFTSNEAYNGGAVYITDGRITQIYNDTFIDNIASHNGGAAYILVDAIAYVDYDLFKHTGIYEESTSRIDWNVGSRNVIYSSLFNNNNLDYFMNVSHVVSGLTAVITVTVPADANKSRNGKVVFDIVYTNETGSYPTQYVLDNFEDNPGTIILNLPSSEVGHYDVVVGFSEDTYLYKQFNLSYNITDPRGDFEILQSLINDAISNHFSELNLTRSYTFTPGNETNPLDFNVYDIEINAPLIINGNGWTINALGYCRIFTINGNNVVLKDLNIINGANATDGGAIYWNGNNGSVEHTEFRNNTANANGGAIYFAETATDNNVLNCTFEDNTAGANGGAIDWDAARGVLNDSTFIDNKAGGNGGALCREVNADGGYGNNNIFENNTAYQGGAIAWMKANNIVINNYTFIDNTAEISGGAIYVGEGSGNCIIKNSNFEGNNVTSTSEGHGGAVEWYAKEGAIYTSNFNNNHAYKGGAVFVGLTSGDINITDSKFTNNSAVTHGGAIDANASSVIISNSELSGNTAQYGGAVYVGGAGDKNSITSCTFTNNNATYDGGAVDWAASNGNILDSTFEYNNAANGGAVFVGGLAEAGSIINSTFNNNHADEKGGAVTWNATIGKLSGSTFFNNSAQLGGATYRGANSTGGFGQDNTYISNHADLDGGAIYWNGAGGNITYSEFYNNTAGRNGGAVYVGAVGATAYITDAIFKNNDAGNDGGAVDWAASNGHILRSTFEYNDAVNGGAVFIGGSAEGGSVVNSTFNHNTATENGGAIDWNATIGRLSGSTFFNNSAKFGGATYRGANSSGGYGYNNIYISNHAEIDGGAIDWNSAGGNITYSEFYNNTAGRNGGAVYVGAVGATAYITDAIFNNNSAEGRGGAVDWDASNGNILRSTFEYNSAEYGGAVFIGGTSGNGKIINSTFNHNHADENGGALDWNSTIGQLINSTFYNNTAKYGGATYRGANSTGGYGYNNVYVSNHAEINGGAIDWNAAGGNVTNSEFRDNTAGNDGGAIYVGAQGATTYITDAKFERNTAGNNGGAVNWDASNGHILTSEFNYNEAGNNGGAVFIGGTSGNGTIINSTFNYNHAGNNGGAIDWNSTIGKLSGSNFTFNSARYGGATFRGANATGGYGYNNIYISNYAEINGGAIDWNATGGNITHSQFYNNTAGENGGALFVGAHGATAYITEAVFENNKAGNRGGAIDIYASNTHIIDSNFTTNTADYGGAVFAGHNAELSEISNSTFISNTATYNGGAVDWNASSGIITGSSFDKNTADYGGAVFVGSSTNDGYVLNSNFTNNVAKSRGGAIDWNASNGHVNDSLFEGNEAIDGGAIYVGSGASNGHVYNSTFVSNRADKDKGRGGAILFHTVDQVYVGLSNFTSNSADHAGAIYIEECNGAVIETSEFTSNSANNDGAIHWEGHNGILRDSVFTSNTAVQDAGAIGWKGIESDIYNVTFDKNTAGGKAGALYWVNVTDDKVYNVTFTENRAFEGGAVYWSSGNGSLYDAKFESNVAFEEGGAIYIDGLSENTLRNATFTSNKATGYFNPEGIEYGDGGAIYITNSEKMDLTDLKFDKNAAALNGGAIYVNGTNDSALYGLTFNDNTANKVGGTIYWTSSSNDTIHDISINKSTSHDEGGAIYLSEMEATLENIAIDQSTATYASAGAIYANGNITINNATLTNFHSLNDVASAILFDGGDSSIANSTLTGNNAIVINNATTVHVTKNTITDDPSDGYAVLNGGTLYLDKNDFDDVIINAGVIETQTYTVVLGNNTLVVEEGSNALLNATIVDDTKNNDIVVVDSFKFHDMTSGNYISSTYSGRVNYGTYESVQQGKYIISASDVGLKNNTILTGTLLVKAANNIKFNITQINEGENVTIKVELVPEDAEYPYEGNISLVVGGKPYSIEIVNGSATLSLYNVSAGTYKVTATYPGDDYHFNATNETYFIVNLRETFISIAVNNTLYGQNTIAVVTTNANGTVRISLNGNKEIPIVNGTAILNETDLVPGKYKATVIYAGNGYYAMNYNETTFEVYKNNAVIDSIEFEKVVSIGNENTITVTMGNVTTGSLLIEVNGVNYTTPIVNNVAKLNVTLPVGKDYAVNAYFLENEFYNATNKTGGTFEVTDKNITVINISSLSVVEVDGKLIINFTSNSTGALNVTVNGNPVTVDENNSFVADTSAAGTYMVIVTSAETATHASGYNSTLYKVIKHNSTVDIAVDPVHTVGDNFTIIVTNNTNVTVTINGKEYSIGSDGAVIIDTTELNAGEYIVTATVAENDKYYGNTSTKVFNINKLASKVNVTAESIVYGNNTEIIVKVPTEQTGFVTIAVGGQNYTDEIKNGEVKFIITGLDVDTYTVDVTFLENGKYNASTNSTTFEVTKANLTATVIANDITVLDNSTFIVSVDPNFKGNVSITVDGVTYDGGVKLLVDLGKLTAGDKTATVKFYGDDNYDDLTMDVNFTVSKLDSPISVVNDGKGTVTVVVPENATGNVTITVDGKTFNGTIENGTAVVYLENVSSGEYNMTVAYPGDDKYKNATLNTTIEIKKLLTPISVNVTNIYVGDVETIVVSLPEDATGNVTISVDGKSLTQPIVNGNATFLVTGLTAGNKTVAVSYIGGAEYDGNFTSADFTVSKRQSYVNVDVEATNVGSTVTINVELPANATGIVVISVDGTNYTVNTADGKGKLEIEGVGNTTHTVEATYMGDDQYLSSTNSTSYGLNKVESTITVEAVNIYKGDVEKLIIKVSSGATGNITIKIGDEYESTVGVTDGTITVSVPDLSSGEKTVEVTYNGDAKYLPSANETTFKVSIKDAVILSDNITAYYNQTEFAIRLADTSNNPIAGETVQFTINGQTYTATTDEYGNAKINLELPLGNYTIETSFTDALDKQIKVTNTIDMLSSIRASDLTRGWNSPYDYMAVFLDGDGHVLVDKEVSFIVNGKTYTAKTDAKGIALLDTSKLAIGKYEVTIVNTVTGEKTTRTTNIVARLIENKDVTMDFVDGTSYVVRVIGDDGKPVGEGEIVDMYANTVHYVAHTDKDGYARLVINLNPNTYKLTAEYKQYKVGNTLVVKQTLKLVKKTVKAKKGKKFKLKAKLQWSNGKAIAGKEIVFKFKGKKYTAKTNSKGIAKVKIKKSVSKKLKKGKKYKYSATYITNTVKGKVKIK